MAQAATHPLLSLPDDEIVEKLREMSLEEILKFSLISERCKKLVKSIQIKEPSITVGIRRKIGVVIETISKSFELSFYQEPDMYWGMGAYGRKKKLTAPHSVIIDGGTYGDDSKDTHAEWKNMDLTMKDWIKHLQCIFNHHEINSIWFSENSSEFDMDDIKEVFGKATGLILGNTGCSAFTQKIVQTFSAFKMLTIKASDFPNSKIPEYILMQHVDRLDIESKLETISLTLDELSLINSKVIRIENLRISPKQLNKFIKLWQHGLNPHMEYLYIEYIEANEEDEEIIMKGIKQEAIPADRIRKFKSVALTDPHTVSGGLDIHRMDGVKASIDIGYDVPISLFEVYVWFDHCAV